MSSVPSTPPQQPHGQADAAEDGSPENGHEKSPKASESHLQQSEALGDHDQPPSASSGKVPQSTDGTQSPENVETGAPRRALILDAIRKLKTWTFSWRRAKPVSDIPSSTSAPHQGPQSSPPAQSARIHDAVGQDQNGKQEETSAQTAPEGPEAPPPSQPAQVEVGAQQQELPDAQPNPASGVSADLTTPASTPERITVTAPTGQFHPRFRYRRGRFRFGDPTVNQTRAVLSLAVELMDQVAQDPVLTEHLCTPYFERFNSARQELFAIMWNMDYHYWVREHYGYDGPLPWPGPEGQQPV